MKHRYWNINFIFYQIWKKRQLFMILILQLIRSIETSKRLFIRYRERYHFQKSLSKIYKFPHFHEKWNDIDTVILKSVTNDKFVVYTERIVDRTISSVICCFPSVLRVYRHPIWTVACGGSLEDGSAIGKIDKGDSTKPLE